MKKKKKKEKEKSKERYIRLEQTCRRAKAQTRRASHMLGYMSQRPEQPDLLECFCVFLLVFKSSGNCFYACTSTNPRDWRREKRVRVGLSIVVFPRRLSVIDGSRCKLLRRENGPISPFRAELLAWDRGRNGEKGASTSGTSENTQR